MVGANYTFLNASKLSIFRTVGDSYLLLSPLEVTKSLSTSLVARMNKKGTSSVVSNTAPLIILG